MYITILWKNLSLGVQEMEAKNKSGTVFKCFLAGLKSPVHDGWGRLGARDSGTFFFFKNILRRVKVCCDAAGPITFGRAIQYKIYPGGPSYENIIIAVNGWR